MHGEVVRRRRERLGLTQRELADRTGLSVRALRDIENGRVARPHARSVGELVAALGLSGDREAPRVGVLGSPVIHREGDARPVGPPLLRDLLGLLALHPGAAVSRDEIVDVLWDQRPPRTSTRLVQVHVGQLRRLLRTGPGLAVVLDGGGYRLDPAEEIDLARFDALAGQARRALGSGRQAAARDLLGEALAVWRGRVLDGCRPTLRQHPAAVAAAGRRAAAALTHADLALATGTLGDAAARLRAVAAEEPLHEGLAARLVLVLAAQGEQAAALAVYAEVRARLVGRLGVEPGPILREAQRRVLRQELATPRAGGRLR